jgi:glucosamine-6-phosphate deaminase
MKLVDVGSHEEMSFFAAKHILQTVKSKLKASLGLATGGTPVRSYELLVDDFKRNGTEHHTGKCLFII